MKPSKDWKREYVTKPRRVEEGKKAQKKPSKKNEPKADDKQ